MVPEELNGATLAYLGDAVLEVMVRERVIAGGYTNTGKLNELALRYVRATEQSKAVDNIIDLLDEEEFSFYRRGKNAKVNHPKSDSHCCKLLVHFCCFTHTHNQPGKDKCHADKLCCAFNYFFSNSFHPS